MVFESFLMILFQNLFLTDQTLKVCFIALYNSHSEFFGQPELSLKGDFEGYHVAFTSPSSNSNGWLKFMFSGEILEIIIAPGKKRY